MRKSIFMRGFIAVALTALAAVGAFLAIGLSAMDAAYGKAGTASLARAASALAAAMPAGAAEPGAAEGGAAARSATARWCAAVAAAGGYRATIVGPDGSVIADSEAESAAMENHASRPEVAAALAGRVGEVRRKSATLGKEFAYAAAPIGGGSGGALRLAVELPTLRAAMAGARGTLAAAAAALLAALVAAAALFSRSLSRPIASLAAKAKAAGAADPRAAAPASPAGSEDVTVLSEAIDTMAERMAERARAAEEQGRRLAAVLDAMPEAVLALDSELRLVSANKAAVALFGLGPSAAGKGLLEVARSTGIQELASRCLSSLEASEAEISLFLPSERAFAATAAPILGAGGGAEGLVLALGDVTEMRRLERVRRDFVANVSHELRTPVQLVKGFAEALEEGAIGDPETGPRFVGLISRNAQRMEDLISDLLSLASLERGGREGIEASRTAVAPILEAAREAVAAKALAAGVEIAVSCGERLEAVVHAGLLEQALVNLLDNAVKFSPRLSKVDASASAVDGAEGASLRIEVRDRGIGIPASDLPRVFERFYRVDKARSRDLGGTGLGLAIVRHIALAHGGSASAASWEGEGSTFTLLLPLEGPSRTGAKPREGRERA
jgi:two-component system, OmpR family, phosphate regulon sensor histidine kinase PhoR